ncbi:hypothetical protein CNO08_14340 [Lysobacter capsici]|nr:hypothetical protein CNO08_14340 [Lysobacter capsici]
MNLRRHWRLRTLTLALSRKREREHVAVAQAVAEIRFAHNYMQFANTLPLPLAATEGSAELGGPG